MNRRRIRHHLAVIVLASTLVGCRTEAPPAADASPALGAVDAPGLHNVFRLTEKLYSGSGPEGDEGFETLRRLGVKTVVTVDGSRPDVARARRFGLRYVHLPIGYDGVPEEQGRRIARAVRDLPGPVYIHCHHGKHRGPAAAAVVRLSLDPGCAADTAIEEMRRAGTDPRYAGLYAAPRELRRPTAADLDALPADFPEVTEPGGLTALMVQIDECWDRIGQIRAARWATPPSHPDIDPPREALLLAEAYREAARLPATPQHPEALRQRLAEAAEEAAALETALRAARANPDATEAAYRTVARACAACHAKYRDVPHGHSGGGRVE